MSVGLAVWLSVIVGREGALIGHMFRLQSL